MRKRSRISKRLVIGLTGGYSTGKTTVAHMLQRYGANVIDADAIGHTLLEPGTRVYRAIVRRFGKGVLDKKSRIDRSVLSRIVFSCDAQLRALNNIIHPEILKTVRIEIEKVRKGVVVLDAPLLVETGFHRYVDRLIVVTSSRARQIQRGLARSRLSKAAIVRRLRTQIPLRDKKRLADFLIDNNGTRQDLRKQVTQIRRMLWTS